MTTATAPVKVSSRIVRMRPGQLWYWKSDPLWREGQNTSDGFWMVHRIYKVAVRIVKDDEAPERTAQEFTLALNDARNAEEHDAQDAFLATVTPAPTLPPEITRLRDAVLAGRAGGATDGTTRKARKAAAA